MAKRGAEALACPARLQSYLCRAPRPKRSRRDLEWREARCAAQRSAGGRPEKRKRGPMEEGGGGGGGGGGAGEEEGAPGKRPAGPPTKEVAGGLSPKRPATPEREPSPWPGIDGEAAAAASGEPSAGRLAPTRPQEEEEEEEENEDDAWQYNSFQYWRCPLPAIDLCDILDLERDDTFETGDSSNVAPSEMET